MKPSARKYSSPLRQSHTQDTRERILQATADLLETNRHGDISMDEIARSAGVERRTVFRHFPSKDALFDAFWTYINARMNVRFPQSIDELARSPEINFPIFDGLEGIIRASLHTETGHAMRLRSVPARRTAFDAVVAGALKETDPAEIRKLTAIFHLLHSAGAWEILRDYAGLDGAQAGEAAAWAMNTLLAAVKSGSPNINPDKEK